MKRRQIEMVMTSGRIEDDRQDEEFLEYWLGRPMAERIAGVERLREALYGENYALTFRLPRSDLRVERRAC